ncbi:MAG: nucleoside recognition protein [Lachnospiraceae bacterium]|nr:nucleoside recognition protein [Lachnospiraceae bacterium]
MKNRLISPFRLTGALLSFLMALLLCFPQISAEGARNGLLLWYQTVLPTLLPFLICTNLLVSIRAVRFLTAPFSPVLKRIFRLSDSGCFVLLAGMLCGYPMGAKNCSDFLDQNCLSMPEARTLYAVSSFPSPMFLAGYMMAKALSAAGGSPFPIKLSVWKMALSVYLPVLPMFGLAARIYGFRGSRQTGEKPSMLRPEKSTSAMSSHGQSLPSLPFEEALMSSVDVMVKIGGYLMAFSILAAFLLRLPLPGTFLPALLLSAAEMTTGQEYASRHLPGLPGVLLILWAGAFGGCSGLFQAKSVTKNAGLSIRHYVLWKLVHSLLSCLVLTLLLVPLP